ncbi:MAG: metal ABC transporter substrate-binding protein [Ilumatobacter sp.]|uniref:metal ABC transporter solute-binding protein, Zn/Mn family n=1 Tax=Ilumatobacter sp. TaxID=1967498 RepID=UPI002A30DD88|nr:metal ABC transporter substrate-binding protein [Ilumatobacter sp.]MDG1391027.1 metal ABC transporter substrate-binding protein [Ilumatobacter sp.]MDG1786600.1 metal ABC transporter substrate-binding protein [Ilumatobacter sp.]
MTTFRARTSLALIGGLALATTACGSDGNAPTADADSTAASATDVASADDSESTGEIATVVVTTNILGDVVSELLDNQADVVTIMPVGADPHDFQASAQEINRMLSADALIVNGANFEEGLIDVIESAEEAGVPLHEAISVVGTMEFGAEGEEHSDEDHSDEEHDEHGHDGADPHFFTDPVRMSSAVQGIVDFLSGQIDGLDTDALDASAEEYLAQLAAVDADNVSLLDAISEDKRVLVTNHEVFAYFADRYGFEVVGVVVPGGSTTDAASAGELAALAKTIETEGVPAIFADTSSSDELVNTLASEVGDIAIVELFTESLGTADSDGATYLDMVSANAERIAVALS